MSEERKYYCLSDDNCKFETMTKEQILAAITQAVGGGSIQDVDTGFVTKVREMNANGYVTFWVGSRAQYNALENKATNCMYIITDDTMAKDMENAINTAREAAEAAAEAATEAAEAATEAEKKIVFLDLSEDVALSWKPSDSNAENVSSTFTNKRWWYVGAMKAIFFEMQYVYSGKAAAGSFEAFEIICDYKKLSAYSTATKLLCSSDKITAMVLPNNRIRITFNEAFNETLDTIAYISGWYFVD